MSVEGFAVVSGNCLFRPSVRSGAAVHASINQHYYHPLRRRLFASLAPSSPVPHTHMLSECCLTFSEGLSLLIPSTRPCRGSRSGIFRTKKKKKRSRFPPWESGSSNMFSFVKERGRAVVPRPFRTLSALCPWPSCPLPVRAICPGAFPFRSARRPFPTAGRAVSSGR